MAVSDRSNPSLARFWGFVLAVMFYGFVMAGLLGFPAHKTGKSPPGPAGTGPAQVAGMPHPESEATGSAPIATPIQTANAQSTSDATPLATAAPPPVQASTTQAPTTATAAKLVPTGDGPAQVTGVPHPESEAAASAPLATSTEKAANAQPNSDASQVAAAAPPSPQAVTTQMPTIAVAAKPASPTLSGPDLADIGHRCGDGQWTWQSRGCPVHPRPVVRRWVLRGCAIRVGNLCIGPTYKPIEVVGTSQRRMWR